MANPTRPDDVGEDAVCVVPGITQPTTIASIEHTNLTMNLQTYGEWIRGLRDWEVNAKAARDAGQAIPPLPRKDPIYRTNVTYAKVSGEVVPDSVGEATSDYYAWVETIVK